MSTSDTPRYVPSLVEPTWQRFWEEHQTFRAVRRPGCPKYYVLDMFPYPSGAGLHVGHPEGYTATDIVARYKRMCGFDVLHPMGWDAFGLPAEQHAIQTGTHPRLTTEANIATFKRQLKSLGFSYDWSRELSTTDPEYVRWTQWIFLQLFHRNLAYQKEISVNWCPALGTVLAAEEIVNGKSERGGHPVESLPLRQWLLRITAYADRLSEDLASLDWPDTKGKQQFWIGRSEGALVDFPLEEGSSEAVTVFTTRVDTLPGVTYLVVAPEHPLVRKRGSEAEQRAVLAYVEHVKGMRDIERCNPHRVKTGVPLGVMAINPINGMAIPIWVADYVLGTYGTGAVMGVPAHDARDHAFATQYNLPVRRVVAAASVGAAPTDLPFVEEGVAYRCESWVPIPDGTPTVEVRSLVLAWLAEWGAGKAHVTYRLRDWVFARQRYWGEPIPIYFPVEGTDDPRKPGATYRICYEQPLAMEESELPLRLPELEDFQPGDDPAGPLARHLDWRFFQKEGRWFARETNTMPQWAGSCWYYLRFLDPHNTEAPFSQEAYDAWMPVDLYVGGSEHAVLHLLYARFWHKVLFDLGLVRHPEPFARLVHQGMILGENNEKMSKSRGNVINPDDIVRTYGADVLRTYEMFMGPLEQVKPWQTGGLEGVRRFFVRGWGVCTGAMGEGEADLPTERLVHKTIQKVTQAIESMRLNTAVSALMILVKHLVTLPTVPRSVAKRLVLLLSPFAPHLGEELWKRLGGMDTLAYEAWPQHEETMVQEDQVEIPVQIQGKLRGVLLLPTDADKEMACSMALEDPHLQAYLQGKTVRHAIYVPGKVLNLLLIT